MGELSNAIEQRLSDAYESLRTAREAGDPFLAEVRQEEISELRRIARNHDIGIKTPPCD